jgi:hypothetical protein
VVGVSYSILNILYAVCSTAILPYLCVLLIHASVFCLMIVNLIEKDFCVCVRACACVLLLLSLFTSAMFTIAS